jgi:hypothetical protein
MRFERYRRRVFFAPVLQQRPDISLVVDPDGLLRRGWVVAGRGRLQNHRIGGGEDEEFSHDSWHDCEGDYRLGWHDFVESGMELAEDCAYWYG